MKETKKKLDSSKISNDIVKIKEEIKSIRFQRNIAILGIVGSILATIIQYAGGFIDMYSKAYLSFHLQDEFLHEKAKIRVTSTTSNKPYDLVFDAVVLDKPLRIPTGFYDVSISLNQNVLFTKNIHAAIREKVELNVPKQFIGSIQVFARLNTIKVYPEMLLPLIVESSEDGFLWIYEIDKLNEVIPLFPITDQINSISSNSSMILPDNYGRGIKAGDKDEEVLLFIVTEENNQMKSDQIAQKIAGVTTKASIVDGIQKYGVFTIKYKIEI